MLIQDESEKRWDAELKHKERLFVLHFCTDDLTFLNATASYKSVYKDRDKVTGQVTDRSNEVCEAASSRLMGKPVIKKAISRLLKETQADLDERNGFKLLKNLMMLADYNPADILRADVLPLHYPAPIHKVRSMSTWDGYAGYRKKVFFCWKISLYAGLGILSVRACYPCSDSARR